MLVERNLQRAAEIRAECARLGLTITQDRLSYIVHGQGVRVRVAYLSLIRPGDLEPAEKTQSGRRG